MLIISYYTEILSLYIIHLKLMLFLIFNFSIEVHLIYNVSGISQIDSVLYMCMCLSTHTHIYIAFQIFFHYKLLQDIEESNICQLYFN